MYGTLGYEDIKIGNLAIDGQIMGVVNQSTSWEDGYGSGILGLGYPAIEQIHPENYTKVLQCSKSQSSYENLLLISRTMLTLYSPRL